MTKSTISAVLLLLLTKSTISAVLLLLCLIAGGCRDDARHVRQLVLSCGFTRVGTRPFCDEYELKGVHLAAAARDLGFPLAAMRHVEGEAAWGGPETRIVPLEGFFFVIDSEAERAFDSSSSQRPLDDPNAICTVSVAFDQVRNEPRLKTESSPRIRITSVAVPADPAKPLQVTYELIADGKTPLGVEGMDVFVGFAGAGTRAQDLPGLDLATPGFLDEISALPGKPVVLTAVTERAICLRTRKPWSELPPGEYVLCVGIASAIGERSPCDYHWTGLEVSDEYKLEIK
jgi:hypothetical protein